MDKALLEVFSGVKNSLIAGAVWVAGLYLVISRIWPWWTTPGAHASPVLRALAGALGSAGLTASGLLLVTLFGYAVVSVTASVWSLWHRAILTYLLRGAASEEGVRQALGRLTHLGRWTRTYSNRSLTRLVEELERQWPDSSEALSPKHIQALASNVIFMAPTLLSQSERRFVEQQRVIGRFELASALALGMPLFISALTWNLAPGAAGFPGYVLAVGSFAFCLVQAERSWRGANSQIAHALVNEHAQLVDHTKNWAVSRGIGRVIPKRRGPLFQRPDAKGSGASVNAAQHESGRVLDVPTFGGPVAVPTDQNDVDTDRSEASDGLSE